jgi:ribulose-phosphate 3-epimerase
MTHAVEIIPAIAPKNLDAFQDITIPLSRFAKTVHVDIADGVFTPDISWPYHEAGVRVSVYPVYHTMNMEAHVMVKQPRDLAYDLIRSRFDRLITHYEAFDSESELEDALRTWRACGVEVGLAALTTTPMDHLYRFESLCDFFQIMTIKKVGHQGEPFSSALLERARDIHAHFPNKIIAADGGITADTAPEIVRMGVSRLIVGSAIMKSPDMYASYQHIREAAESAL